MTCRVVKVLIRSIAFKAPRRCDGFENAAIPSPPGCAGVSSVGVKAIGTGTGDGGDDEEAGSLTKDNQMYGVLEALLDLRYYLCHVCCWCMR